MDDEQRQRKLLADQIARAATTVDATAPTGPTVDEGLVRDPEVKLSFSFGAPKPKVPSPPADSADSTAPAEASTSTSTPAPASSAPAPVKLGFSNPLKRAAPPTNVFKMGGSKPKPAGTMGGPQVKLSATQQLIKEDEERKRRMAESGGRGGFNAGGGKRLKM